MKLNILVSLVFLIGINILYLIGSCPLDLYVLILCVIMTGLFTMAHVHLNKKIKDLKYLIQESKRG